MPASGARQCCAPAHQGAAAAVARWQEAQAGTAAGLENPGQGPRVDGPLAAQLRRSADARLHGSGGGDVGEAPGQVPPGSRRFLGFRVSGAFM